MENFIKITNYNMNGSLLNPRYKSNISDNRNTINNKTNLRNSDNHSDLSFNIKRILRTKNNFFSMPKQNKENLSPFKAFPQIKLLNNNTPLRNITNQKITIYEEKSKHGIMIIL